MIREVLGYIYILNGLGLPMTLVILSRPSKVNDNVTNDCNDNGAKVEVMVLFRDGRGGGGGV